MKIEYEATFIEVDKDEIRARLRSVGAQLVKEEFMQRRTVFNLPPSARVPGSWIRVRDEGEQITVSVKIVDGDKIENQKETCLTVDNYTEAETFLSTIGCEWCAYQETLRERWELDGVEVTIDTWPFLEPFVEVESDTEARVRIVAEKLGFDWATAKFCSVDTLYHEKYGTPLKVINDHTPKIVFEMENPFMKA